MSAAPLVDLAELANPDPLDAAAQRYLATLDDVLVPFAVRCAIAALWTENELALMPAPLQDRLREPRAALFAALYEGGSG